jgi:hypothetical protein
VNVNDLTFVKTKIKIKMKKTILSLAFIAFVAIRSIAQTTDTAPNAAPADNPNAGDFSFTEETYDFQTIPRGTPVTHEFNFVNTGKEPIVISNVQASCGCTTPTWPKEPILPGKSSIIKVQYNAANPGGFNKSITITSNAKSPTKVIYIKGTVQQTADQTTPEKPANMLTTPDNH